MLVAAQQPIHEHAAAAAGVHPRLGGWQVVELGLPKPADTLEMSTVPAACDFLTGHPQ